jgi:hypothetical protein
MWLCALFLGIRMHVVSAQLFQLAVDSAASGNATTWQHVVVGLGRSRYHVGQ